MPRIALIVTYLAGAAVAVILLNANREVGAETAILIWAAASLLLGWGTGRLDFAFLALLAIPFAVPFGNPDHYPYSEPLPIWWSAMIYSGASACLIFASALVRAVIEAHRRRTSPGSTR